MKRRALVLVMLVVVGCRDRPAPNEPPPVASVADAAPASAPRVVCAPVQGPTLVKHDSVDDTVVASADGTIALHLDGEHQIELRAPGGAARRAKLPGSSPNLPQIVFRGPNLLGFGAASSRGPGGSGYVVWATGRPLALAVRAAGAVERAGSRVYFNDNKCIIHAIDLALATERGGATKACASFRVWGDAIAVGEPRIENGIAFGVDFGGRVVAPATGKPLDRPYCPHPVGGSCVTFADDLHEDEDDDPPGPASASTRTDTFEARGPIGPSVRGETVRPHHALSPEHARLWRDAAGRILAFVASRVDGASGPQLVVVDETHVATTPLAHGEEIDQRRIDALRGFVPASTPPEDDAALVAARAHDLAASTNDHVRFMGYAAAASAHVPCTAPPP